MSKAQSLFKFKIENPWADTDVLSQAGLGVECGYTRPDIRFYVLFLALVAFSSLSENNYFGFYIQRISAQIQHKMVSKPPSKVYTVSAGDAPPFIYS